MCVASTQAQMEPSFQAHGTSPQMLSVARVVLTECHRTARVWKEYQPLHVLEGHDQAVWAVLSLGGDDFLTGLSQYSHRHESSSHIYPD